MHLVSLHNAEAGVVEDKYSYITTLDEIAENDYNLNIPRYVDTFEEEEPVDLKEVAQDLKQLNEDMKQTDHTIAAYCKELGLRRRFKMVINGSNIKI